MVLKINAFSPITWLKVANEYEQKKKKLSNVINESNVKLFDILSRLCVDLFLKKAGRDLLSKHDAVMESVVDKEKLMECTRGNPVICKQVSVFHHHKNELNKLKIYLAFPNKFIINTWTVI